MNSEEKVKKYLAKFKMEDRILCTDKDSSTVSLAAIAFNTEEARIAKTLSFKTDEGVILIVCAGDTKIDNAKYKAEFGQKAHMLAFEEVYDAVGHPVGGVCPFAVNSDVKIYLDDSLKRFTTVFPACGATNNAIEVTPEELETVTGYEKWVDVCKIKEN